MSGHVLHEHAEELAVVRLPPGADVPDWAESSVLLSVTATAAETSVVCAAAAVPRRAAAHRGFRAFAVAGPLDPGLAGVLSSLLEPLAAAGVGVLTIATFDTDWILVPSADARRAAEEWRRAGHTVVPATDGVEDGAAAPPTGTGGTP